MAKYNKFRCSICFDDTGKKTVKIGNPTVIEYTSSDSTPMAELMSTADDAADRIFSMTADDDQEKMVKYGMSVGEARKILDSCICMGNQ